MEERHSKTYKTMSEYEREHGEDRDIEPDTVGVRDYVGMGIDAERTV